MGLGFRKAEICANHLLDPKHAKGIQPRSFLALLDAHSTCMCGCVCACLSPPVVCCWAIWQLPSTPNCRIMQQTCVNLEARTRTEPSCPSLERTCLNLQAQIRTPHSPILEQTCSQLQAQTLGTPNCPILQQSFVSICKRPNVISKCRSRRTNLSYRTVVWSLKSQLLFWKGLFLCCCTRSELGVALEFLEREGFGSGSGFDFCLLILIINYLLQLL